MAVDREFQILGPRDHGPRPGTLGIEGAMGPGPRAWACYLGPRLLARAWPQDRVQGPGSVPGSKARAPGPEPRATGPGPRARAPGPAINSIPRWRQPHHIVGREEFQR